MRRSTRSIAISFIIRWALRSRSPVKLRAFMATWGCFSMKPKSVLLGSLITVDGTTAWAEAG